MGLKVLFFLAIFGPLLVGAEDYYDYNFDYDDYDDYDGTDIYVPPPEPDPVRGFFQGPLPYSVELNLTLIYDLDLLKQFHGRKDYVEDFLMRIVALARPHLQQHNLKVQIHIKVTLYDKGSPTLRKTVYIWALPKLRLDPPLLRKSGHFVAQFVGRNFENSLNSHFDFGNEYFDSEYGQR